MRKTVTLCTALFLLASACGGDDAATNPKESLTAALENLSELEGLDMVLTIESTPESLTAMASSGGDDLSEEDAEKILDSSVAMKVKGTDPEDAQSEFVVTIAGEESIEMKAVDQVFYIRADVRGLVETFGGNPASLDQFEQQASAAGITFVEPALAGEWIGFEGLEEIAKQQGFPTAQAPDQKAFVRDFQNAVEEEAKVTAGDAEGPGDHLVVDLPVRDLYERMLPEIQKLMVGVPAGALPPASEVPNETVRVDVWVDADRVTQIQLDFLQFAKFGDEPVPEGVERFALRATIDEFDGEVEAPDDAVTLTPDEVRQAFGALLGAGAATGGDAMAPQVDCKALEQAPPNVQKQFAGECPQFK